MSNMPKLPFEAMLAVCDDLNDREKDMIRAAFNGKTGQLKTSLPYKYDHFRSPKRDTTSNEDLLFKGCANYVWRMLCFSYAGFHPHYCMPVMADCTISFALSIRNDRMGRRGESTYDECRDMTKAMDQVIAQFEKTVPVTLQAGTMRWARAFGVV